MRTTQVYHSFCGINNILIMLGLTCLVSVQFHVPVSSISTAMCLCDYMYMYI
jgi:hypothetical protein